MLSLLPARVLRLLEWAGFSGDKVSTEISATLLGEILEFLNMNISVFDDDFRAHCYCMEVLNCLTS